jgi:N-methylhydantoinase B/oxoprolinase/acetone carboxylase alpha subunit
MRGGMTQCQVSAAAKKDAAAKVAAEQKAEEERTKLAHAEGLDTFQRAFTACMAARNYSVK